MLTVMLSDAVLLKLIDSLCLVLFPSLIDLFLSPCSVLFPPDLDLSPCSVLFSPDLDLSPCSVLFSPDLFFSS